MRQFLLLALVAAVGAIRYDGYQVYKVGPVHDMAKLKYVASLVEDDEVNTREVVLMDENYRTSEPVYLAVSPRAANRVASKLEREGIEYAITNRDLQKTFDENMAINEAETQRWKKSGMKGAPTSYLSYADQVTFLQNTAASSPIASTFSIGNSHGGRNTMGIVINEGRSNLPAVWIDSQIHAREWIASATVLYILEQILIGNSADAVRMRENYRWYIVPNVNPDGYEYTRTNDRMWRKNRAPISGSTCIGTDLNRNFGENFGGEGSSNSPCQETYRGPSAFSEVESRNMRDYLTRIAPFTNVMISIHSYSNYWLVPWGGYSYKPADYNELMRVGNLAATAIRGVNGLSFTVGTPPDILYVAAGGSFDWTKAQLGMAYSYSPELRPATAAQGGFDIPATNITPSGAEIFAAVVATVTNANHKV